MKGSVPGDFPASMPRLNRVACTPAVNSISFLPHREAAAVVGLSVKAYGARRGYILLYLEDRLNPGIRSDVRFIFF